MSTPSMLRGGSVAVVIAVVVIADGCAPRTATDMSSFKPGALPCEVDAILEEVCQQCHSSPPKNEAPFSLVTYGDTQVIVNGRPITSYMLTALETGRMPIQPVLLLPADRETLLRWLRSGAPPRVEPRCEPSDGGAFAIDAEAVTTASDASEPILDAAPEAEPEIDAAWDSAVEAEVDGGVE